MDEWNDFLEELTTLGRHPVPETELDTIEQSLGQPLPNDYREFCERVGSLSEPLYIYHPKVLLEDSIAPPHILLFGSDGGEIQFGFDAEKMTSEKCTVVAFDAETDEIDEVGDFKTWIQREFEYADAF